MIKLKDIDVRKLNKLIDKYWIGRVYGYLIFVLFFSLGVIVGRNGSEWLYVICNWLVVFSAIVVYPITFIRYGSMVERRKEKEKLDKENKNNHES